MTKIQDSQMPSCFIEVIKEQISIFKLGASHQDLNKIPEDKDKFLLHMQPDKPVRWFKISKVICVFVDMKGSTQLTIQKEVNDVAKAYQLFTNTAIKLFNAFNAPYIDIKGDGVFALFNSDQPHRALASAVTFKTFCHLEFASRFRDTGTDCHIGIDQNDVLVRALGLRGDANNNEVWAGKPVNMASKLAGLAGDNQILASERFFKNFKDDLALKSCGCKQGSPTPEKVDLWKPVDVSNKDFLDFNTAYKLLPNWCSKHGKDTCNDLLKLDENN